MLVESGESLESLLTGRFREILHMVIRDHLSDEIGKAERRRKGYVEGLRDDLLAPLSERVDAVVRDLFPEITGVTLTPRVPEIDHTLSDVDVRLADSAETALASKGTGVRGAVMVAMLRYLADQTRRSIVFAVEEPESFLHPGAQEALRDDLESLAERRDVTLLVTTHSPFVVSRHPRAQVVSLTKEPSGRTVVAGTADGDAPQASLLGGLFRDAALPDILDRVAQLPSAAKGVLVVEGGTDKEYIEIAAKKARRLDLLDGLHVAPAGGASKAVVQTLLHRSQTDRPVHVLLDTDELGLKAIQLLVETFGLQKKKEVLSYRQALGVTEGAIEAEDLWPSTLLAAFVHEHGEEAVLTEKTKRKDGCWHFGFNATGKELLPRWLARQATARDCDHWIALLQLVRKVMGLAS